MNCSSCGHQNRPERRFCAHCGAALPVVCPACAAPLDADERFCGRCGAAVEAPAAPLLPTAFGGGRYLVTRLLGEGGRKRVFLATDTRLEREVAIAAIKTDGIDELGIARVRQEARAMGRLGDHPHIVTVFDVGDEQGQPYIVSQFMSGGSIDDLLQASPDRRLPVERAVRIAEQVTRALERAHELGIIHRDVKPGNVWLSGDGTAKLGDFGLALVADRVRLTQEGTIVGTVTYMAPEQALGRALDGRTDLYALGAMLYELVAGRPPFLGDSAVAIVSQHLNVEPVAPSWHNPAVPALLEGLILRLLAKTPADRPASAAVVREALASIATLPEPRPAPPGVGLNPLDRLAGAVFVGRAREMEELRAAADDARAGRGRIALISGDPGIGKTRTASEVGTYARMRGFQVLWGRAHESEGAPAYWPWVQLVRQYLHERDPQAMRAELGSGAVEIAQLVPEVRDLLTDVPTPPPLDSEQARFRLFDAVATFLRNAAARQPIALVLDDVHWADASSLLLLEFLAGEVENARLVVLATFRDLELVREHPLLHTLAELARVPATRRVRLQGLTAEDVARYIELTAATTAPPALVTAVHAETEGNPFFVGEVVRLLAAEGRLGEPEPGGGWKLSVPQGVREVLGRRLGRLSPECNEVLTTAAVVGREFGLEVLEPLTGRPGEQLLEQIQEAIGARLLTRVPEVVSRFRFAHALVRETLYDDLGTAQRVRLHQQVAETLEAIHEAHPERHLAELAYHYAQAAMTARLAEKAIAYARRAGAHAVAQLAYEEGARLQHMALDLLAAHATGDESTRGELLLELGETERRAGSVDSAKTAFRESADVARRLDLPDLLARAALAHAGPGFIFGQHDPTEVALLEEALRRLDPADGIVRAKVLARLTMARFFAGEREAAVGLSLEAVDMARRLEDPATLAYALHARHVAIWSPASVEERLVVATEMMRVAEAAGDREEIGRARHLRIVDLLELGDLMAAYREMDAQSKLADELRQPLFQWHRAMYRTLRALLEGRFAEGERLAQETLAIGQKASPDAMDTFAVQAFQVWREQGRVSEVEAALTAFVLEQPAVVTWRGTLSYILLEAGHEAEGRREFERLAADGFASMPVDPVWTTGMSMLCEACAMLGDAPRAQVLHDFLEPYAGRLVIVGAGVVCNGPVSLYLGMLDTVLERWDEAAEHLEAARAASARIGSPPWLARSALAEARLRLARRAGDDRERAVRLLEEVVEITRELGMTSVLEKALALRESVAAETDAGALAAAPEPPPDERPVFRCEGEYWTLAFEGRICRLKDAKGLHHIAQLLRHPGERFEARALASGGAPRAAAVQATARSDGAVRADLGDAGTVLDARAKDEYRRRLAELREELEEAESFNDPGRAEAAREEIELLTRQLSAAVGLGGRDRKVASANERARLTVTKRIKDALARITESHSSLGQYLGARIKTGYLCSYTPDPRHPVVWDVVA